MHRFVVFAQKLKGFDTMQEAESFARMNLPAVICERRPGPDGTLQLVEVARHDYLYDAEHGEWRVMMG